MWPEYEAELESFLEDELTNEKAEHILEKMAEIYQIQLNEEWNIKTIYL